MVFKQPKRCIFQGTLKHCIFQGAHKHCISHGALLGNIRMSKHIKVFGFVGVVGDTGLIHHIATIGNTCRTYFGTLTPDILTTLQLLETHAGLILELCGLLKVLHDLAHWNYQSIGDRRNCWTM